ncbi:MAG: glutathione S-transferase N-terminal domain-containing protein, partial [Gammaproteobacteria bacterium]
MTDIILHHYPQSPVAEKVRVVLGMKNVSWHSVQIPRLPPKPDLMPLTGGYRRTPVLQVGADIYCDSQCIIRELERRCPQPTLFPNNAAGLPWAVSRWTDGPLFTSIIGAVMGAQADELPEEFASDRGRLYFGPNFDWQAQKKML